MQIVRTSFVISLCFIVIGQANAQRSFSERLFGGWEGQLTTNFQGEVYRTSISLQFDPDNKVIIRMSKSEEGTYNVTENSISISVEGKTTDMMILSNVVVNQTMLSANVQTPSDPPGLRSMVQLSRIGNKITPSYKLDNNHCGSLEISEINKLILKKYNLSCPVHLSQQPTWYEYRIVEKALSELATEYLNTDVRIEYSKDDNKFYGVFSVEQQEEAKALEKVMKPFLKEPEHFTAHCRCCGPECVGSIQFPDVSQLKPEFLTNNKINLNRIWSVTLTAAESVEGIKIDLSTVKHNGDERVARSKFRRLPIDDSGFIVAEQTTVRMKDAYKNGEAVEISVISRVLRRGISERQWVEINLDESVKAGARRRLMMWRVEDPCMTAILKALLKTSQIR